MQNKEAFFALPQAPTTHSPEESLELFGLDNEGALKNPTLETLRTLNPDFLPAVILNYDTMNSFQLSPKAVLTRV